LTSNYLPRNYISCRFTAEIVTVLMSLRKKFETAVSEKECSDFPAVSEKEVSDCPAVSEKKKL